MKTKLLLCIAVLMLSVTCAFAAAPTDTVISQEALLNMNSNERNAIFDALKEQNKLKAKAIASVNTETVQALANMDVETFKGKAVAVADTLVVFFDKLGVKANEFVKTDVGLLAAIGIIYKMGVFGSLWDATVGTIGIGIFLIILYKLNTRKIIVVKKYGMDGKEVSSQETLVPKFSAVGTDDDNDRTIYSVIGSIICVVMIVIFLACM